MRNHLSVFLLVLVFSVSLNQGAKLKSNDRRASGLMAYPRVGRSDLPATDLSFNRRHDTDPDTEFRLYNSDLGSVSDKDYEDLRNSVPGFVGGSMSFKHVADIPKGASWLIPDRLRSAGEYRPWQKFDDGSRSSQLNGYTPRLGRENDVERLCAK